MQDYFDIVKNPIDLSTIKRKLDTGQYQEPWQYVEDVWLMFNNAWLYNRKTSRVYKYCTKLAEVFEVEIDPVMQSLGYCCGRKVRDWKSKETEKKKKKSKSRETYFLLILSAFTCLCLLAANEFTVTCECFLGYSHSMNSHLRRCVAMANSCAPSPGMAPTTAIKTGKVQTKHSLH